MVVENILVVDLLCIHFKASTFVGASCSRAMSIPLVRVLARLLGCGGDGVCCSSSSRSDFSPSDKTLSAEAGRAPCPVCESLRMRSTLACESSWLHERARSRAAASRALLFSETSGLAKPYLSFASCKSSRSRMSCASIPTRIVYTVGQGGGAGAGSDVIISHCYRRKIRQVRGFRFISVVDASFKPRVQSVPVTGTGYE